MQIVIDKIFDLYLIQNKKFLIQLKNGEYVHNQPDITLGRFQLSKHLLGGQTIGTFSDRYRTKFICFDIDCENIEYAKWMAYKITNALFCKGFGEYAVSFSGKKGYHIEIFLDKAISNTLALRFFHFILYCAEIPTGRTERGQVEYRPSNSLGVKIPLGVHQITKEFCGFCCVEEGMRVLNKNDSIEYLTSIRKSKAENIINVLNEYSPDELENKMNVDLSSGTRAKGHANTDYQIIEKPNEFTFAHASNLYQNGMSGPGQRHSSFMLLARLMNHNGVRPDEAKIEIMNWLEIQNEQFYKTSWDECLKDASNVIDFVYSNNLSLFKNEKELVVSTPEIDAIIKNCIEKNLKLLMYSILIHSKRWAAEENGNFYMTYEQMALAARISIRTTIRLVKKLEDIGMIEVLRRDQKQKGTFKKLPNIYRLLFEPLIESELPILDNRKCDVLQNLAFEECLKFFYSDDILRQILPRRQYSIFTKDKKILEVV